MAQRMMTVTIASLALVLGLGAVAAEPAHAAQPVGAVNVPGGHLNVRSGPSATHEDVGDLDHGTRVEPSCKVRGEMVDGASRRTSTWVAIGKDRWLSNAYLDWSTKFPVAWCEAGKTSATSAKVSAGGASLNVRERASTGSSVVDRLEDGSGVTVSCQVWGTRIEGDNAWYRLGKGRHVSGRYVSWSGGRPWLPWCGQDAPTFPRGGHQGFIDRHSAAAQESQRRTGVPASVTLAQAVLETGWGESALAVEDHNIFGMKCFGSPGDFAVGCRDYGTFECTPSGSCENQDATFRAYRSIADSYRDHGELLSGWSRYAQAMAHRGDPKRFARELQKAGYATDPKYADKLIGIMGDWNLYAYNKV
ncbi:sporangiospore maturation cell wall hydrolase GsmA [Salininema proteolyticum]|uniref:Sporangiospore maturation cell wall hydrolase GsmA n=1 Tax=Salininema proteolyticum TaxID=1607685 RepID=A0ABV8U0H7_9ACTN